MSDIRDILELEQPASYGGVPSKDAIVSGMKQPKKPKRVSEQPLKRPEGMHRELFALLYNDNRDSPSLAPSDTTHGYKQLKAKLGRKHVRPWKWVPFKNPARPDGAMLYHWRRGADEAKEYPFARFDKKVDVPTYTNEEYKMYLNDNQQSTWTQEETDHLFELCRTYDLRFIIINDRYDREKFQTRTIEDLKDRYYSCVTRLLKARVPTGQEPANLPTPYHAQHETDRKRQLLKLYNRTQEQVQEEEMLMAELRKIEMRKKEREKKQQDLQKLITAAENSAEYRQKREKKPIKKKVPKKKGDAQEEKKVEVPSTGVKFPENKGAGVFLRSARLKMPGAVGTKKTKAVEQLLEELGVDLQPMPTESISQQFNELRNDMILLYELKQAAGNCEFEQQTLKHRIEALAPGKDISHLLVSFDVPATPKVTQQQPSVQSATPLIDAVTPSPGSLNPRKRRTASVFMDQNPLKKKKF
ncbi:DNA methyltransferase 1-associated protein 1 isoform X2 [Nematostella vectensis]|uniref:DNA methyltransferase 1-associated protein 1 isoform X2 n=1 Tax=Nematostella vectensis TaxID=45351 RepID=UPI00138FED30|nr:DNA methyltransferase 1-associated protein 1 isoform X2 [Nematostella vectensis]